MRQRFLFSGRSTTKAMRIRFAKMQAFGNDYVYIDAIHQQLNNLSALARFVSDRHFGVGSDGMVLICPSETADFRMRIFNPDGTEAEMCGNASRSVGKFVYDHGFTDKTELTLETLGGIKHLTLFVDNGQVINIRADIGAPVMEPARIPVNTTLPEFVDQPVHVLDRDFHVTALSWGNPHMVTFVDDVSTLDVNAYGYAFEHLTSLFPQKTNVTFAEFVDHSHLKMREWERGTGETIGCGTGCCTAVVAAVRLGMCSRNVTVSQIGGPLDVEWDEQSGHVLMTGPSHTVFESDIEVGHIMA